MLTKFESKSSAAKAIAFHPRRPWILVALYSSTIQLWDYRMGTVIDRFEGHEGPVRCVDFHDNQPIFCSCGDDSSVRVWSLGTRKLLFTLEGHFDYVRTVFFHKELPWIISASDDQTIRIWNWQNRQEIACITGHSHWVSCAQFHPTEDLVVSASLDLTVRVWDISGLRKRHSAPGAVAPQQFENPDLFTQDAVVKWVLEGHDRGVNWAAFHPTLPLIVSAGDDRVLKVWRTSESRAWEVDTCRGHTNNVTCCAFHPFQDLIISTSDDKTLRTWDLNRRTPVRTFKRDSDKVWNVSLHPTINLIGAAHDSGVLVFKMERERPASVLSQGVLTYVGRDKTLKTFDPRDPSNSPGLVSLKKLGSQFEPIRELSYNPSEKAFLACSRDDQGVYLLAKLPSQPMPSAEPARPSTGRGDAAFFISRNRFAVFDAQKQTVDIRDLDNAVTKTVALPIVTKYISSVPIPGHVLLLGASSVVLYDLQQKKIHAKVAVPNVKYAVFSLDNKYVALLAKHKISIATKDLELVSSLHETIRIKSAAWDENNVLVYSTFNHLKYSLLNGDTGMLKTLSQTLYVTYVKRSAVYCLSCGGNVHIIRVDPTEYKLKRALVAKNFGEVARIIKTSSLVGQSIIAYLQQRGYPEIALQFVQDPQTRFDLAIECGDLATAKEQAALLDKPIGDKLLAQVALELGNHDIVEDVYQKQRDLDKLSLLYLITGNKSRLQKMEQIAQQRQDPATRFQTSVYLNSVDSRVSLLCEAGQPALAYALAKSNGLNELAASIAAEQGVDPADADVPFKDVSQDPVPGVSFELYKTNWPLKPRPQAEIVLDSDDGVVLVHGEPSDVQDLDSEFRELDIQEAAELDELDDLDVADHSGEDAWDLGDAGDADGDEIPTETEEKYPSTEEGWLSASQVAADHVAAGSFESAAQLLNRQIGLTNFAPLRQRFLDVYSAARVYLRASEGLPPLELYIQRDAKLPYIPGRESLHARLQDAYKLVKGNKIELAVETFREILYTIVVLSVDPGDVDECRKIVEVCKNYILAFSIELKRRSLAASDKKRNLELAAYFTKPKLKAAHQYLPYQVALTEAYKAKNFALASFFATEFLKLVKTGPSAEKVRGIKARCGSTPLDALDIDFDAYAEFDICPGTLTPIYGGQPRELDPLTRAPYHASEKGRLCAITNITTVGAPASGLRLSR